MGCGRGLRGSSGDVCPAATEERLNGIHDGKNGGRTCWAIAGTLCGDGKPSGKFAQKMETCLSCPFYRLVRQEETNLRPHQELLLRLIKI